MTTETAYSENSFLAKCINSAVKSGYLPADFETMDALTLTHYRLTLKTRALDNVVDYLTALIEAAPETDNTAQTWTIDNPKTFEVCTYISSKVNVTLITTVINKRGFDVNTTVAVTELTDPQTTKIHFSGVSNVKGAVSRFSAVDAVVSERAVLPEAPEVPYYAETVTNKPFTESDKIDIDKIKRYIASDGLNKQILVYILSGYPVHSSAFCKQCGIDTRTMAARVSHLSKLANQPPRQNLKDRLTYLTQYRLKTM